METEVDQTSQQIMADTLNSEMDRYWTRFNIFAAVQVGAVVGVLSTLAVLLENPTIFRFVLLFLVWFSVTGALAVLRGHDLQRSLVLALAELEESLPESQRLLARTRKHFRMPTFISNYACSVFAIFCVCWALAWLWLEWKGYAGILIPKP
jgi:uncharacterized membrane protein YhaH (DUF805 family)